MVFSQAKTLFDPSFTTFGNLLILGGAAHGGIFCCKPPPAGTRRSIGGGKKESEFLMAANSRPRGKFRWACCLLPDLIEGLPATCNSTR